MIDTSVSNSPSRELCRCADRGVGQALSLRPELPPFVFVVPMKGRATCANWRIASTLCGRAVHSLLADPSAAMRVILVCNEIPESLPTDHRLIVKSIDTPVPTTDYEKMTDKFVKFKTGLIAAREFAPCWLMRADADDLVSNRIVSFIMKQEPAFWYSEEGWLHQMGSPLVIKCADFHTVCGTSHVAFVSENDLPSSMEDNERYYMLHESHVDIVASRRRVGAKVFPIPFPTTIYVINSGENYSGYRYSRSWLSRNMMKFLLGIRPVTTKLREEFGLRPLFDKCR
jgi:hypothetical protein